jgi:predicted small secreted protein
MMKKSAIFICLIVCVGLFAITFTACSTSEGGSSDFTKISGCGYITLTLNGAGDHNGRSFFFGASGIQFGPYERSGTVYEIMSGTVSTALKDPEFNDLLFIGGDTVGSIGGFIDVNGNMIADDGDYLAGIYDYVVDGDDTITLTYPNDFTQITGSGIITIAVTGAESLEGAHGMCGAGHVMIGGVERCGNNFTIVSGGASAVVENPESGDDYIFTGGQKINLGCLIDGNGDDEIGDGDYYAKRFDYSVNGTKTVTFAF